jgi:hypothetical protein
VRRSGRAARQYLSLVEDIAPQLPELRFLPAIGALRHEAWIATSQPCGPVSLPPHGAAQQPQSVVDEVAQAVQSTRPPALPSRPRSLGSGWRSSASSAVDRSGMRVSSLARVLRVVLPRCLHGQRGCGRPEPGGGPMRWALGACHDQPARIVLIVDDTPPSGRWPATAPGLLPRRQTADL